MAKSKKKKKKEKKKKKDTVASRAKRRAETHKAGFENTAFEVPDDKNQLLLQTDKTKRLDIIPYTVGEGNPCADPDELYYERTFFVHRGVGADQTSYVCLRKTNEEACPICEYRASLMKDSDADEDEIKDLAPKERQLFNVIDTKDRNKGVQVWEMSFHLFGKRLDKEIKNSDEDDKYENFAELEGGFTLKCGVEEQKQGGYTFFEVVTIHFKPRSKDYDEDIVEEATCLDDILIIKDYDELKQIFLQTVGEDGGDGEGKSSKKKKKSSKGKDKKETKKDDDTWEESDRVVVEIEGEDYPGEITEVDEDEETATVEFDDGEIREDIPFDDLEVEPTKSSKKKKSSKDKDKKGKKGKCPGGGTFGEDTDELPECKDCKKWDACDDVD